MKSMALGISVIFGGCSAMEQPKADPSKIMELQKACTVGDVKKVAELMRTTKIDSSLNGEGYNFIHYAAVSGSPETLQLMLDANPKLIDIVDCGGNIPFSHLFLDIYQWRQDVETHEIIMGGVLNLGFVRYAGHSTFEEHIREQVNKRVGLYKRMIDIFIDRGANLEIANDCGKKWVDIPGLDHELANYAEKQIAKKQADSQQKEQR